jgi:hypothetical protein
MKHLALALALALATSSVAAQSVPAAPGLAPSARPAPVATQAAGNLARFIVGPGGRVRGIVLHQGTVALLPPRAGAALAQSMGLGVPLRVEGLAHPGATPAVIFRATIRAADGTVLFAPPPGAPDAPGHFDDGDEHPGLRRGGPWGAFGGGMGGGPGGRAARLGALPPQRVSGAVQQVIAGPRGRVRMLLLANQTTVTLPRQLVEALAQRGVRVGEVVQVSGRGTATPQGTGLVAEQLTFADGTRFAADPAAPATPTR